MQHKEDMYNSSDVLQKYMRLNAASEPPETRLPALGASGSHAQPRAAPNGLRPIKNYVSSASAASQDGSALNANTSEKAVQTRPQRGPGQRYYEPAGSSAADEPRRVVQKRKKYKRRGEQPDGNQEPNGRKDSGSATAAARALDYLASSDTAAAAAEPVVHANANGRRGSQGDSGLPSPISTASNSYYPSLQQQQQQQRQARSGNVATGAPPSAASTNTTTMLSATAPAGRVRPYHFFDLFNPAATDGGRGRPRPLDAINSEILRGNRSTYAASSANNGRLYNDNDNNNNNHINSSTYSAPCVGGTPQPPVPPRPASGPYYGGEGGQDNVSAWGPEQYAKPVAGTYPGTRAAANPPGAGEVFFDSQVDDPVLLHSLYNTIHGARPPSAADSSPSNDPYYNYVHPSAGPQPPRQPRSSTASSGTHNVTSSQSRSRALPQQQQQQQQQPAPTPPVYSKRDLLDYLNAERSSVNGAASDRASSSLPPATTGTVRGRHHPPQPAQRHGSRLSSGSSNVNGYPASREPPEEIYTGDTLDGGGAKRKKGKSSKRRKSRGLDADSLIALQHRYRRCECCSVPVLPDLVTSPKHPYTSKRQGSRDGSNGARPATANETTRPRQRGDGSRSASGKKARGGATGVDALDDTNPSAGNRAADGATMVFPISEDDARVLRSVQHIFDIVEKEDAAKNATATGDDDESSTDNNRSRDNADDDADSKPRRFVEALRRELVKHRLALPDDAIPNVSNGDDGDESDKDSYEYYEEYSDEELPDENDLQSEERAVAPRGAVAIRYDTTHELLMAGKANSLLLLKEQCAREVVGAEAAEFDHLVNCFWRGAMEVDERDAIAREEAAERAAIVEGPCRHGRALLQCVEDEQRDRARVEAAEELAEAELWRAQLARFAAERDTIERREVLLLDSARQREEFGRQRLRAVVDDEEAGRAVIADEERKRRALYIMEPFAEERAALLEAAAHRNRQREIDLQQLLLRELQGEEARERAAIVSARQTELLEVITPQEETERGEHLSRAARRRALDERLRKLVAEEEEQRAAIVDAEEAPQFAHLAEQGREQGRLLQEVERVRALRGRQRESLYAELARMLERDEEVLRREIERGEALERHLMQSACAQESATLRAAEAEAARKSFNDALQRLREEEAARRRALLTVQYPNEHLGLLLRLAAEEEAARRAELCAEEEQLRGQSVAPTERREREVRIAQLATRTAHERDLAALLAAEAEGRCAIEEAEEAPQFERLCTQFSDHLTFLEDMERVRALRERQRAGVYAQLLDTLTGEEALLRSEVARSEALERHLLYNAAQDALVAEQERARAAQAAALTALAAAEVAERTSIAREETEVRAALAAQEASERELPLLVGAEAASRAELHSQIDDARVKLFLQTHLLLRAAKAREEFRAAAGELETQETASRDAILLREFNAFNGILDRTKVILELEQEKEALRETEDLLRETIADDETRAFQMLVFRSDAGVQRLQELEREHAAQEAQEAQERLLEEEEAGRQLTEYEETVFREEQIRFLLGWQESVHREAIDAQEQERRQADLEPFLAQLPSEVATAAAAAAATAVAPRRRSSGKHSRSRGVRRPSGQGLLMDAIDYDVADEIVEGHLPPLTSYDSAPATVPSPSSDTARSRGVRRPSGQGLRMDAIELGNAEEIVEGSAPPARQYPVEDDRNEAADSYYTLVQAEASHRSMSDEEATDDDPSGTETAPETAVSPPPAASPSPVKEPPETVPEEEREAQDSPSSMPAFGGAPVPKTDETEGLEASMGGIADLHLEGLLPPPPPEEIETGDHEHPGSVTEKEKEEEEEESDMGDVCSEDTPRAVVTAALADEPAPLETLHAEEVEDEWMWEEIEEEIEVEETATEEEENEDEERKQEDGVEKINDGEEEEEGEEEEDVADIASPPRPPVRRSTMAPTPTKPEPSGASAPAAPAATGGEEEAAETSTPRARAKRQRATGARQGLKVGYIEDDSDIREIADVYGSSFGSPDPKSAPSAAHADAASPSPIKEGDRSLKLTPVRTSGSGFDSGNNNNNSNNEGDDKEAATFAAFAAATSHSAHSSDVADTSPTNSPRIPRPAGAARPSIQGKMKVEAFPAEEETEHFLNSSMGRHASSIDDPLAAEGLAPRRTSFGVDSDFYLPSGTGGTTEEPAPARPRSPRLPPPVRDSSSARQAKMKVSAFELDDEVDHYLNSSTGRSASAANGSTTPSATAEDDAANSSARPRSPRLPPPVRDSSAAHQSRMKVTAFDTEDEVDHYLNSSSGRGKINSSGDDFDREY